MKNSTVIVLMIALPTLGVAITYFILNQEESLSPEQCLLNYYNIATVSLGDNSGYGALYGVAANDNTNKIYVTHSGNGTIAVIDGLTDRLVNIIPTTDSNLAQLAVNPFTNKIYAAGERLWIIDGATASIITSIPMEEYAIGVTVDTSTNKVYVASNDAHIISVIDGATDTKVQSIPVSGMPRFVAANSVNSKIYVSTMGSVVVIDGSANNAITNEIYIDNSRNIAPGGIAVNPASNKVYAASSSGKIAVINGTSNIVIDNITLGSGMGAFLLATNPESNEVFAGVVNTFPEKVAIIDANNNIVKKTIDVGHAPFSIAVNIATGKVYVANVYDGTVSIIAKTDDCSVITKTL